MPKVFEVLGPRKLIGKNSPVNVVEFNRPFDLPTGLSEPEFKTSDACADASKSFGFFIRHFFKRVDRRVPRRGLS